MQNTKKKDIKRLIFILIPIYIFIISLFFGLPQFDTNDDVLIMNVLSGRLTGEPYGSTNFFHVFLGYIISRLYKVAFLPWYPIFIISTTLIGQITLFDIAYDFLKSKGNVFIKTIVLMFFLFLSINIIITPTYTVAATLLVGTSIYLLYKNKKGSSVILLLLATAIRHESGFVGTIFWAGMLVYKEYIDSHITGILKLIKKVFWKALWIIVSVLLIYASDVIIKNHTEPKGYIDFREGQRANVDYAKNTDFYQNKEQILESIDWDTTLYDFITSSYFSMDERITVESMQVLNKYKLSPVSFNIKHLMHYIHKVILEIPITIFILLPMYVLALYHLYILYIDLQRNRTQFIIFLLLFFISSALILYLFIVQRTHLRGILAVGIPQSILMLIGFNHIDIKPSKVSLRYIEYIAAIIAIILFAMWRHFILILLMILLSLFNIENKRVEKALAIILAASITLFCIHTSDFTKHNEMEILNKNRDTIELYAHNHIDNIYVSSPVFLGDSRMIVPKESCFNLFNTGGTFSNSDAHIRQMKRAGLQRYDIAEFAKDNVYLIDFDADPSYRKVIEKLLSSRGISGQFKLSDTLNKNDIAVYRFIKQ